MSELSVIIPIYNEEFSVDPLFAGLIPVLDSVSSDWEIICVDDGSHDGTFRVLDAARARRPEIRLVKLSRNFGKDAALSAGLQYATGQSVLLMDGDLQHPPEVIPQMLDVQATGIDVVYGLRRSRDTDVGLRRTLSSLFYRVFSGLSDVRIVPEAGDFRLLSRRVVDALNALPEQHRFMKGLYAWVGFSQRAIAYDVAARCNGASKWSTRKLFDYAWNGIVSFSTLPLRLWSIVGSLTAIVALLYAAWIVVETLIFGRAVPGYATLATAIFFLGGLQLLSIGVLGEYIARIFAETKRRPLFIVEEKQGFEHDQSD